MAGHFAKANAGSGRGLWEFRVDEAGDLDVGGELAVDQFEAGQIVDVQGTSRGKGYAGTIKRWRFFAAKIIPMATLSLTVHRAPLVNAKPQVGYSKARRCPATWARQVTTQGLKLSSGLRSAT